MSTSVLHLSSSRQVLWLLHVAADVLTLALGSSGTLNILPFLPVDKKPACMPRQTEHWTGDNRKVSAVQCLTAKGAVAEGTECDNMHAVVRCTMLLESHKYIAKGVPKQVVLTAPCHPAYRQSAWASTNMCWTKKKKGFTKGGFTQCCTVNPK